MPDPNAALASALRSHARQCPPASEMAADLNAAADLLDPPPPSLYEDVQAALRGMGDPHATRHTDAALDVVFRRIEASSYTTVPHWIDPASGACEKAWRESTIRALFLRGTV